MLVWVRCGSIKLYRFSQILMVWALIPDNFSSSLIEYTAIPLINFTVQGNKQIREGICLEIGAYNIKQL